MRRKRVRDFPSKDILSLRKQKKKSEKKKEILTPQAKRALSAIPKISGVIDEFRHRDVKIGGVKIGEVKTLEVLYGIVRDARSLEIDKARMP